MYLGQCMGEMKRCSDIVSQAHKKGIDLKIELRNEIGTGSVREALDVGYVLSCFESFGIQLDSTVKVIDIVENAEDSYKYEYICIIAAEMLKNFIRSIDTLKDAINCTKMPNREFDEWKATLKDIYEEVLCFILKLRVVNMLINQYS